MKRTQTLTQPGPERVFLGLDQPPLSSAVEWLVNRYNSHSKQGTAGSPPATTTSSFPRTNSDRCILDLSQVVLVTPTSRSRIRLLQMLVDVSIEKEWELIPPQLTTLGQFPELLYSADKELATELAQQIAWSKALEESPESELQILTGRSNIGDLQDWQPMAKLLSRLHRRLANDVWSFRSVAREVKKLKGFLPSEVQRWEVLEKIQSRYYAQLSSVDLWDRQAARSVSIHRGLCSIDRQVVLIGVADLNQSVRRMLAQIQSQVYCLIAAPEDWSDRFDEFGNLETKVWSSQPIQIDENQIRIVDRPEDQALAVAHFLSELEPGFSSDQVTIGTPDEDVTPHLEKSLDELELPHRNLAGATLNTTTPVRLMLACQDYLEREDYDSFASLVRQPDLFEWLNESTENPDWMEALAAFQNEKLPSHMPVLGQQVFGDPTQLRLEFEPGDKSSQRRAERWADQMAELNQIHTRLQELLGPLAADPKPIAEWTEPWNQVLVTVYSERQVDLNSLVDQGVMLACDAVYDALGNHRQIPEKWRTRVRSTTALEMAIEAASEQRVVEPPIESAIELAGWLDLALDDAPVMAVTGMNDESVPSSEVGHQFLPNKLCERLGIEDNQRRFARDVYALSVILAVRPSSQLLLVTGRQDDRNDPLKPSRLLFAADPQTSARRAAAYFSFDGESVPPAAEESTLPLTQQLEIPEPLSPPRIQSLTVTSFKEYLKCPYRFYLGKVLRLQGVEDTWRELNAGLFGDLTHEVLESFGRHEVRRSESAAVIEEFLSDQLSTIAHRRYEGSRLPSVKLQIEQLRMRLARFAIEQAAYRREGWLIVSVEEMLYHELIVDGEPFQIRGKIDRVDRNEQDDRVAIWDYKTSDRGDSPGFAHYSSFHGWKDLQLPLYRYLVREVAAVRDCDLQTVSLGYVMLPKQIDRIGFETTEWDDELLQTADQAAFDVIRAIRDCQYWPPVKKPPMFSGDFAAICQDNVFEKFEPDRPEEQDTEIVEAPF